MLQPRSSLAPALLALVLLLSAPLFAAGDVRLARAQAHVDAGQAAEALALAQQVLDGGPRNDVEAEALLLRSTAMIMLGDVAGGYRDLKRAVRLDPTLRQAWLNLAGLEIAEREFDAADKALRTARELDPTAADTYLNLGAVSLLQGNRAGAEAEFERHLELATDLGEAHFLVAANFALLGIEGPAVAHLTEAVQVDERHRLRARLDERFGSLDGPAYRQLLTTDLWSPAPDTPTAAAAFRMPYRRQEPHLVHALLDGLRSEGIPYEAGIEATDHWALVWAEGMRLKLYNQANGTGVVSATAREGLDRATFEARSQQLFRAVHSELRSAEGGRPSGG